MNTNHHATCVTCDYCQPMDGQRGFCRRLAPRPTVFMKDGQATVIQTPWPLIDLARDWCGEHRESKVKVVKAIELPGA